MPLKLERLLMALIAPLFAAATGRKKKPLSVRTQSQAKARRQNPVAKSALARKPSRRDGKKPAHVRKSATRQATGRKAMTGSKVASAKESRGKKTAPRNRLPVALPTLAVAKSEEGEPQPKPLPPTGRAILLSPEDEKFAESAHPTFRWLSVGNATRYEVAWGEDPNLTQTHSAISIATNAAVPVEKPLRIGVTYYWHVRGGNEGGWGPWSAGASFRVIEGEE